MKYNPVELKWWWDHKAQDSIRNGMDLFDKGIGIWPMMTLAEQQGWLACQYIREENAKVAAKPDWSISKLECYLGEDGMVQWAVIDTLAGCPVGEFHSYALAFDLLGQYRQAELESMQTAWKAPELRYYMLEVSPDGEGTYWKVYDRQSAGYMSIWRNKGYAQEHVDKLNNTERARNEQNRASKSDHRDTSATEGFSGRGDEEYGPIYATPSDAQYDEAEGARDERSGSGGGTDAVKPLESAWAWSNYIPQVEWMSTERLRGYIALVEEDIVKTRRAYHDALDEVSDLAQYLRQREAKEDV